MSDKDTDDRIEIKDDTQTKKAYIKVKRAKARLLLEHPFWGQLVSNLKDVPSYEVPIGATDGKRFIFNPQWIEDNSFAAVIFLIAHEAAHCALLHIWRRGDKDPKLWNLAVDYVVNDMLVYSQIGTMPPECLYDEKFKGMHAERIYADLQDANTQDPNAYEIAIGGQGFSGSWDSHGNGDTEDASEQEVEWKATAAAAAQSTMGSKQRGDLPAGMQRLIDGFTKPSINWVALLAAFVDQMSKDDYSWTRQNRRFIYQDLYLPSLYSQTLGKIAMFVDTSGSMSQDDITKSMSEVMGILTTYTPDQIHFGSCDTEVVVDIKNSYELTNTQEAMEEIVKGLQGGGGTSFTPVFDYIKEQDEIKFIIYFTDGYGLFPDPASVDIPTFWIVTPGGLADDQFPFGKVIRLPEFDKD